MIKARCPICGRLMEGEGRAAWPQFPFCSPRCRTIDLGRWLGESYGVPSRAEGEPDQPPDDPDLP